MDKKNIRVKLADNFLKKYNPYSMNFLTWLNSCEYILDILSIKNDDKGKFLLTMVEPFVFTQIHLKLFPTYPFDLSYDELISIFEDMFAIEQGERAMSYRFFTRTQLPREPVEHYVLVLRKLLSKSSPGVKSKVDIKIQFIYGLEDMETKALLLEQMKDITFATAIDIAKKRELASKELKINFDENNLMCDYISPENIMK